jgi:hypothetical protein
VTHRTLWRLFGLAWLALVGWLTLRSAPDQASRVADLSWHCVFCGDSGGADFILNILLFLPLGFAARGLGWSWRTTMLVIVPITLAIETTQGLWLVGRDAALGDVLANSLGGAVGWLLLPIAATLIGPPTPAQASRALWPVVAVTIAIWLATAFGFQPALSDAGPYVGQITHHWPYQDPFPGKVTDASLDGIAVPNDPLADLPAARHSVVLHLTAERTAAPPRHRSASLLRVVDADGVAQVTVNERDGDLLFQGLLRASHWHLHTPTWRFQGALALPLHTPAPLEVQMTARAVALSGAANSYARTLTPSIGRGWAFIHPFVATISKDDQLWTVLWLGWWFGLIGWLAGACSMRAVVSTTVAAAAAFAAASWLGGVSLVPWELLVGTAALLILAGAATRIRRQRPSN